MSDTTETVAEADAPADAPAPTPIDVESEPETFGRDYVAKLRAEAAEARVRAKLTDAANEQLLRAYATADGRLVDGDALPMSPDLLGDDGIVSEAKVRDAVDSLLAAKPYLHSRRPVTSVPHGVREDVPDTPGLLSIYRQRMS